jgi:DNA invertase Pin-like site-specific DNA recombinase
MDNSESTSRIPAALYARKSADEQLSPSSDTGNQIKEIREWAALHGFEIVEEFVDEGLKGWTLERAGIQSIQKAIRERNCKFKALIVSAWDRLSRDIGDAFLLTGELEAYGIRLISVRQGEASDENAKLGRAFYFIIAKQENTARGGHILAGQKRWASEGYSVGGLPPYGYRRKVVEDAKGVLRKRYEIDPEKAEAVKNIYAWYAEGRSVTEITRRLNALKIPPTRCKEWSYQVVWGMLFRNSHQEKYLGAMVFNRNKNNKRYKKSTPKPREEWVFMSNAHESILSSSLVEAVRKVKQFRKGLDSPK